MDWLLTLLPVEHVVTWLGELAQTEFAKITLLFFLAAETHKRAMKKEFTLLRGSIDHVADVMGKRIDGIESRLFSLEKRKPESEP